MGRQLTYTGRQQPARSGRLRFARERLGVLIFRSGHMMFVNEYVVQLANEKLAGNLSRFDELSDLVPDFAQKLRAFDSDSAWLHWRKKTYDSWY